MIPAPSSRRATSHAPLCPECQKPTSPYRCEGTLIFKCSACHGLWLGGGKKLGTFRSALDRFNYQSLEVYAAAEDAYVVASCFACQQTLDRFHYGYNSGVSLYRCARCRGLWMPLRELVNLMDSLRLGQSVREDVRALLKELKRMHGGLARFNGVVRALRSLV